MCRNNLNIIICIKWWIYQILDYLFAATFICHSLSFEGLIFKLQCSKILIALPLITDILAAPQEFLLHHFPKIKTLDSLNHFIVVCTQKYYTYSQITIFWTPNLTFKNDHFTQTNTQLDDIYMKCYCSSSTLTGFGISHNSNGWSCS